jgi:hypothetical protein
MTLDRVNGGTPYFPAGETAYLFGYYLMDQISKKESRSQSDAKVSALPVTGEMSIRSSGRLPYFINGNVENITGKDWYAHWDDWVANTRARASEQLQSIRTRPLTTLKKLTKHGRTTLGSAFSPNGKWVAYTQETMDTTLSLWVAGRTTNQDGQTKISKPIAVERKLMGSSIAFTADSQSVIFSSLRRKSNYAFYSDLAVYHLKTQTTEWLTDGMRAKDPDISPDGKRVTFVVAREASTGIAVAELEGDFGRSGSYGLKEMRIVHMPAKYDASNTPKFSRDGKKIIFTLHRNGQVAEDLMSLELATGKTEVLLANGAFNRFPAIHPDGTLYFVSDSSGIDNIYRYDAGIVTPVTHVTTGLWFPSFAPDGSLHANVLSFTGWDLAAIESRTDENVAIVRENIPNEAVTASEAHPIPASTEYSIFPSIWPRQWAPLLYLKPHGLFAGAEVIGFDAVDRHRYLGLLAYDSEVKKADGFVYYANRSWGPTFSLSAENRTSYVQYDGSELIVNGYTRFSRFFWAVSYPFLGTFSSWAAAFAINAEQSTYYELQGSGETNWKSASPYIPTLDWVLSYSGTWNSPLAIAPEQGRSTTFGVRRYLGSGNQVWKAFLKNREFIHLGKNSVLIPSFKASWVSATSNYAGSYVNVQGPSTRSIFGPSESDGFDQLTIRGYPNRLYFAKSEESLALDFRFPIARIFRGWGTNPLYFNSLYGFTFGEFNYFPNAEPGTHLLPSAGGGIRLQSELLNQLPVLISLEYNRGFSKAANGSGEVLFYLGVSGLSF